MIAAAVVFAFFTLFVVVQWYSMPPTPLTPHEEAELKHLKLLYNDTMTAADTFASMGRIDLTDRTIDHAERFGRSINKLERRVIALEQYHQKRKEQDERQRYFDMRDESIDGV